MTTKNIVLLHGWGANISKLNFLKRSLEKLGWRVYVPKLPGFEISDPAGVWQLSDYAKYVTDLCGKRFKGKYFLFGHSFGGRVAIKISVTNPKKVSGLILCSSGGLSRGPLLKRLVFSIMAKMGMIFMVFPSLARTFRKALYKLARERDYYKASGVMKETFKKVISEDLKKYVKNIDLNTLVLWGKNDRVTSIRDAKYLVNNLKKVSFRFYEEVGHRLPYEKPGEMAQEINKWYTSQI